MITPFVDAALEPLAGAIGFPVDRVKYVLCILLSYPLGTVFRKIPTASGRHMWSTLIGALMILMCYDVSGLIHFLAGPLIVYGLLNVVPSKYAPRIGFLVMMGYLSALHIHRMFTDYMGYTMDVTTVVMVTVIKVTSFACNIRDGKLLSTPEQLTPAWKKYAIAKMPSPFEYISFLFFFPTFLAGPAFHFSTYKEFAEGTLYKDEKFNPEGKEPSPVMASVTAFGQAILCLVIHVACGIFFPSAPIFAAGGLDNYNILVRLAYLHISFVGVRCQYYFAWKLSEGAGILAGLGFEGYTADGKPIFERLCNIYISKVEFAGSVRDLTIYWNYATGEWLKNYVYTRQAENVQARVPTWAMYVTNIVSAFWHGFYPGYYLAFAKASFEIDIFRQLRTRFRPMFTKLVDGKEVGQYPAKHLYDLAGWLLQAVSFGFGMAFFVGLSWANALTFLQNYYYLPFIAPLVVYGILTALPKPKGKKE